MCYSCSQNILISYSKFWLFFFKIFQNFVLILYKFTQNTYFLKKFSNLWNFFTFSIASFKFFYISQDLSKILFFRIPFSNTHFRFTCYGRVSLRSSSNDHDFANSFKFVIAVEKSVYHFWWSVFLMDGG